MDTIGKGGQLYPLGREEREEGESKGSCNRRKEGGMVLAYCSRAIKSG